MQFTVSIHPSASVPGIYLLRAPRAAYVGQSEDIRARFLHHLHLARTLRHPRKDLNGKDLTCEILEIEPDGLKRLQRERFWITQIEGTVSVEALGIREGTLTPDQVRMIRSLQPKYGDHVLQRAADQLGVSVAVLYAIRKGKTYKHISDIPEIS